MHLAQIKTAEPQGTSWTHGPANTEAARSSEYRRALIHSNMEADAIAQKLYTSGVLTHLVRITHADSAEGGYLLDEAIQAIATNIANALAKSDGGELLEFPRPLSTEHHAISAKRIIRHLKETA